MTYGNLKSEIDNSPVLSMFQSITNNINTTSSDSGEEVYMIATVTLNNDQILHLPTTPIDIIPAPGIGKYIIAPVTAGSGLAVLQMHWIADYVGAGGSFQFGYGDFTDGIGASYGVDVALSFLNWDDANDALWPLAVADISSGATGPDYKSVQENQSISIRIKDAPSGNFTGGDSGNTLKITVLYQVVDL